MNFKFVMGALHRRVGDGERIPPLSVGKHFLLYRGVIDYRHFYQKEADHRPLDSSEEVRNSISAFHHMAKRYPFPRGGGGA